MTTAAQRNPDMSKQRKRDLLSAIKPAITEHLRSTHGAFTFGARSEMYTSTKSEFCLVVKAGNGEFYLVEVKKSGWSEK